MSESRNRIQTLASLRKYVPVVAGVYAINLAVAACVYLARDELYHYSFAFQFFREIAFAGLIAEIGCLALWACLSACQLMTRMSLYAIMVVQLAHLYAYSTAIHSVHKEWDLSAFRDTVFAGIIMLVLIGIVLRLFPKRIVLVHASATAERGGRSRLTLLQTLFFVTFIAVLLAAMAISEMSPDEFVIIGTWIGSVAGLSAISTLAGLAITMLINWRIIQLLACAVYTVLLETVLNLTGLVQLRINRSWWLAAEAFPTFLLLSLMPIVWIWMIGRYGYRIRCVVRKTASSDGTLVEAKSEGN